MTALLHLPEFQCTADIDGAQRDARRLRKIAMLLAAADKLAGQLDDASLRNEIQWDLIDPKSLAEREAERIEERIAEAELAS